MALDFGGDSYVIYNGTPPITDSPFTIGVLFNTDVIAKGATIVGFGAKTGTYNEYYLRHNGAKLGMRSREGAGIFPIAESPAVLTGGVWYHGCGIVASDTDRRCFVNGISKGTNTTTANPNAGSFNVMRIGSRPHDDDWDNKFNGPVGEVTLWNVALTDAEVEILPYISPYSVRPQNIVLYKRMIRNENIDEVGGLSFTEAGSPTIAAHPRIFDLAPHYISSLAAAEAAAVDWIAPFGNLKKRRFQTLLNR